MATLMERAAALERQVAVLEKQRDEDKDVRDEILAKVTLIEHEMTRYRGFLGGVAFLGACFVTAATLFKDWLMDHLFR
jgi:hypothetical protein